MQKICEDIYENDGEFGIRRQERMITMVRQALFYKIGEVKYGWCCKTSFVR